MNACPEIDAARHNTARGLRDDRVQAAEISMINSFLDLVQAGDMNARATFAPMVGELVNGRWTAACRYPTIAECCMDSLNYADGPSSAEVISVLVAGLHDGHMQAKVCKIFRQMAEVFAINNCCLDD